MSKAILSADSIHKAYRMGREDLRVLRGCDLAVRSGEFVAVMGKSGSGKSTLLHILGALDVPQKGEVYFQGKAVCQPRLLLSQVAAVVDRILQFAQRVIAFLFKYVLVPPLVVLLLAVVTYAILRTFVPGFPRIAPETFVPSQRAAYVLWTILAVFLLYPVLQCLRLPLAYAVEYRRTSLRRRSFGFVFQFYHLLPELNVLENVLVTRMADAWTLLWPFRRRAARADTLHVLKRVGLSDRLKHKPNELSGGERQRVAIARALVHHPQILFADEPTGNLDAEAGANIMSILTGLHGEGQTIVMVTHDPGIAEYADRVLLLEDGRLRPA